MAEVFEALLRREAEAVRQSEAIQIRLRTAEIFGRECARASVLKASL